MRDIAGITGEHHRSVVAECAVHLAIGEETGDGQQLSGVRLRGAGEHDPAVTIDGNGISRVVIQVYVVPCDTVAAPETGVETAIGEQADDERVVTGAGRRVIAVAADNEIALLVDNAGPCVFGAAEVDLEVTITPSESGIGAAVFQHPEDLDVRGTIPDQIECRLRSAGACVRDDIPNA